MLSDHQCELLTAYVDGELDPRARLIVDRLLSSSMEAREFLEKLEGDSHELHNLPSRKAPETLADAVMVTVNDNNPLPARKPALPVFVAPPPATGIPSWLGLGLAACVLAAAGVATFFLASGLLNTNSDHNLVAGPNLDPFLSDVLGNAALRFGDEVSDADIGVRLAVAELGEEPVKTRLVNELKERPSAWFDVPATKNNLAIEQLTKAFKAAGLTVLVDPTVNVNLAKKDQKVKYVFYAENLSHDEVTTILQNVSLTNVKAKEAKALQDTIRMTAISVENRTLLAKSMGIDPKKLEPPLEAKIPMMIAPSKQIGLKQIPERLAMLLTLSGEAGKQSAELSRFLASRQSLQYGMAQIVMVIREEQIL